jgi:hypothetical protein
MSRIFAFALLLATIGETARAAEPYHMASITLLQPDAVLRERVPGGAEAMSNYIGAINEAASKALAASENLKPATGFIVLAVRPGGHSKVWLDLWPSLPDRIEQKLIAATSAVKPFEARNGVVVFGISVTIMDAAPTKEKAPRPAEWTRYTRDLDHPIEIGDLVDRIWPAKGSAR